MRYLKPIAFAVLLLAGVLPLGAQQVNPRTPPPPPPADTSSSPPGTAPATTPATEPATSSTAVPPAPIDPSTPPPPPPDDAVAAPAAAVFDPLHAGRSLDVGTFYLRKGNYDAAIDRFQEAARYQPKLAKPWVLLGEAYEKKHDNAHAVEAYKKYLDLFPTAEDAAKVQKRISELEEKTVPQASKETPN
jgi:tetratricopeptide (TPR) repeat protein